ncbi:MAG: Gfo/Idh/MocA family oxidoreductase [Halorientalis sp.]
MTEEPIPVGVVGAGNMGSNHVRVYDELPEANLVEVVEPDPDRATDIREQYDVQVLDHPDELDRADAVTVSVPNEFHRETAETCLRAGLDVLVEKPLATTVEDAQAIADLADEMDAILQVGHIERFNPAVQTLQELLADQQVIAIEAHRLGPFNEHLSEESVILDLMIHDLDVIDSIVSSPIQQLHALGLKSRSQMIDHAVAQLQFGDGILATTTASHVTNGKVRTLDVITRDAYITLDYQEQTIVIQRQGTEETTTLLDQSGYRTETVTESPYIKTREPLKIEIEHFVDAVRDRKTAKVSGKEGVAAVDLANRIVSDIRSST